MNKVSNLVWILLKTRLSEFHCVCVWDEGSDGVRDIRHRRGQANLRWHFSLPVFIDACFLFQGEVAAQHWWNQRECLHCRAEFGSAEGTESSCPSIMDESHGGGATEEAGFHPLWNFTGKEVKGPEKGQRSTINPFGGFVSLPLRYSRFSSSELSKISAGFIFQIFATDTFQTKKPWRTFNNIINLQ